MFKKFLLSASILCGFLQLTSMAYASDLEPDSELTSLKRKDSNDIQDPKRVMTSKNLQQRVYFYENSSLDVIKLNATLKCVSKEVHAIMTGQKKSVSQESLQLMRVIHFMTIYIDLFNLQVKIPTQYAAFSFLTAVRQSEINLGQMNLSGNKTHAIKIIADNLSYHAPELSLPRKSIKVIPNLLLCFTNLSSLNLFSNELEELHDFFGLLRGLKKLDLRGNQLRTLPSSIGLLVNLKWLDLESNKLEELPHTMGNLKEIEELYLGHNPTLASLPHTIGNLTKLQKLHLVGIEAFLPHEQRQGIQALFPRRVQIYFDFVQNNGRGVPVVHGTQPN